MIFHFKSVLIYIKMEDRRRKRKVGILCNKEKRLFYIFLLLIIIKKSDWVLGNFLRLFNILYYCKILSISYNHQDITEFMS